MEGGISRGILSMGRWMTEVEHRVLASESGDPVQIPTIWFRSCVTLGRLEEE